MMILWRFSCYAIAFLSLGMSALYFSGAQSDGGLHLEAVPAFSTTRQSLGSLSSQDLEPLCRFIKPELHGNEVLGSYLSVPDGSSLTSSHGLHLLRMFGAELAIRTHDGNELKVLDLFTDLRVAKSVLQGHSIVKTAYGARFPTGNPHEDSRKAYESHRDQCLATFAEIGLPLQTRIYIEGETFTLTDVLRDSIANFHLKQQELEWTTIAYTQYLPPSTRTWTNRYGQSFTFDELAGELLDRPWGRQSCGGLHCLASLTAMYRADSRHRFLSEQTRLDIGKKLRESIDLAVAQQKPDGRWHPGWAIPRTDTSQNVLQTPLPYRVQSASDREYVLATGHTCEWLLTIRGELEVPQAVFDRSRQWLITTLAKSKADERWTDFCPWSHAVQVVFCEHPK